VCTEGPDIEEEGVVATKQKSLLERTNSWTPFIEEVGAAINARDFRKETIEAILHIVDPTLSMWAGSVVRFLLGACIGCGFPYGRKLLYQIPFQQFLSRKRKVFVNAPLPAIQRFNTLVATLFSPEVAKPLLVDEKLARRWLSKAEELRKKEEEARANFALWGREFPKEVSAEQKIIPAEIEPQLVVNQEEVPQGPPPLFSASSMLDEDVKARIKQVLSLNLPSSMENVHQAISMLEKAVEKYLLQRQNFFVQLASPQLLTFRDLPEMARRQARLDFDEPFLARCFQISDQVELTEWINRRVTEALKPFTQILEKAERRSKTIKEIRSELARQRDLITPFLRKAELREQAELLLNQLSTVEFPTALFESSDSAEVDTWIAKKVELYKTVSGRIEEQFREFIIQGRILSRAVDFLKMMVYAARWEVLGGKTPYQDLRAASIRARDQLLQAIELDRESVMFGRLSLQEYALNLTTAIYEQDIKLIRGELTARSLILKDLRQAVAIELLTIDRQLSLLSLSGNVTDKALLDRQWLASFFYHLLSPYRIFQDTYDPESINVLFRYWWIDVERFLKKRDPRNTAFFNAIRGNIPRLIRPIARTIDALEKAGGGRPMMYQRFLDVTKEMGGDVAETLDRWLDDESRGGVAIWIPQLALIPQVEQEPIIERLVRIDQRMKELTSFAKALQAVKTFEPERIDSLLELFSVFPVVEFFDQPPVIRLNNQLGRMEEAIGKIEEELVVELGLLDKKARMELGYAINNLLPQALLKIPPIIDSLTKRFQEIQQLADPYVSSIAHFILDELVQLARSYEAISGLDQDQLFALFQKLAITLFHRTMLDQALQPRNFSRVLLVSTAVSQLVGRFRQMEEKGELVAVTTLIDELDGVSAGRWELVSPDLLKKSDVLSKLNKCVSLSKRICATGGLTERREAMLTSGIEKVCQELTEDVIFDIPRLSFVPGDLDYFWHVQESEQ
jgi:hypothetical protein